MLYKKVALAVVVIVASSTVSFADMSGQRGAQQRQRDIDATYSIDRRADPAGLIDRAPKREMKMVPFPRGGRLEMILVPADPTV